MNEYRRLSYHKGWLKSFIASIELSIYVNRRVHLKVSFVYILFKVTISEYMYFGLERSSMFHHKCPTDEQHCECRFPENQNVNAVFMKDGTSTMISNKIKSIPIRNNIHLQKLREKCLSVSIQNTWRFMHTR